MSELRKAFNLPIKADDCNLVESPGNVCATFNLPNEAKAVAVTLELFEQQQAIIEKLESELTAVKRENHELAAHLQKLRDMSDESYSKGGGWCDETLKDIAAEVGQYPTANLAERDAEVVTRFVASLTGVGTLKEWTNKSEDVSLVDQGDVLEFSERYVERIKRGEV